jgi:hypothetical protein
MKRRGKCINFGNCPVADRKQIVELDITEDFLCPDCGNNLVEDVKPPSPVWPKILIVVILLAGIGFGAYWYFTQIKPQEKPQEISQTQKGRDRNTNVKDTPDIAPINPVATNPEPTSPVSTNPAPTTPASSNPTPPNTGTKNQGQENQATSGTVSVEGGTYTGEVKNKQPHGMGTIRYNARTLIDSRDPKKRYAESGQYITGEFYNGRLVQGKLYDNGNNQLESIILGRVQ